MTRTERAPWALLGLFVLVFFASAWISDDAFITFRSVDNVLAGHGPTWNPEERVQSFTHPLWYGLLVLGTASGAAPTWVSLTFALLASGLGLWLVMRRVASSPVVGVVAGALLLSSKAYADYASSGLEDPLTRLLLIAYAGVLGAACGESSADPRLDARQGVAFGLLAGLGALCRPDAFVLFVPGLVFYALRTPGAEPRRRWARWRGLALGLVPLALWGAFAFVYFGSPLPNTAYAKLSMGVPRTGLLLQGLAYLADSLRRDPLTLLLVVVAAVVVWRRRDTASRLLVAGGGLYLGFVLFIGGDYMSGRLLAAPFLLSILALAQLEWDVPPLHHRVAATTALVVLLGLRAAADLGSPNIGPYGVSDERRTHHPYTGLVYALVERPWPQHPLLEAGHRARSRATLEVSGAVGMFGYAAGPQSHIVDLYALTDPLLARLPGIVVSEMPRAGLRNWRPGHTQRPIPEGYLETLRTGTNHVADPDLATFYDHVREATRGDVWSPSRWRTSLALFLGRYDHFRDAYVERHPHLFDRFGPPEETMWSLGRAETEG